MTNVIAVLFGTVLTALLLSLVFGAEQYMVQQISRIPQIECVSVSVDYSTGAEPISNAEVTKLEQWPEVKLAVPDIKQMAWLYRRPTRQTVAAFPSAVRDDPAIKRLDVVKGTVDIDPEGWQVLLPERVAYELDNFDPHGLVDENVTLELRRYSRGAALEEATPTRVLRFPVKVVGIVKSSPHDRVYASINMVRFVRDFGTMRSEYVPEVGGRVDLTNISPKTMYEALRLHFDSPARAEKAFNELRRVSGHRYDINWAGRDYLYLRDVQLVAFLIFLGIGILTIMAGSISIFNTLQASILRKTREIGILRALGLNRLSVFLIYSS